MRRRILFVVGFLVIMNPSGVDAQISLSQVFAPQPYLPNSAIIPVPNSAIHYTQIMFDHPPVEKAVEYRVTYFQKDKSGTIGSQTINDSSTASFIGGFQFDTECWWFYEALNAKGRSIYKSPEYRFTILPLPSANRVRVFTNNQAAHQGGLISFDYHTMIFDRDGKPVWFLPDDPKHEYSRNDKVRDLRVTAAGTITFITTRNAFEIMPDGRISWRAPKSEKNMIETLHHGVERLPDGHLMTLGNHTVKTLVPGDSAYVNVEYGVIGEYDRGGKLIWKWDSYDYIKPVDLEFRKIENGRWICSSHMNAFRQTEENGVEYVWAGFRDLDRIIKIEKSTGAVVEEYGRKMKSGSAWTGHNFFHAQHDVTPLSDGNIAVFNNDSVSKDGVVSSIVIFSTAKLGQESRIIWRFACDFDKATNGKSEKCGSVDELPNGNLLVNFGTLNRTIEITRDGKIVWDVFTEYYATDSNIWRGAGQYRSHYSSSLYPCYFTAAVVQNTKKAVTLTIWNEGSENDTYHIEYKSGDVWVKVASNDVAVGKRTTCVIPKVKAVPFTQVRVISGANPDFTRVLNLQ